MLRKAADEKDARGASVLREKGEEFRAAWGCGGAPKPLGAAQTQALSCVGRLIGEDLSDCPGCPLERSGDPDVSHAVRLHRWWSKGELAARGPISHVEIDAVDAIEDGRIGREANEVERLRQKAASEHKRRRNDHAR